MHYSTDLPVEPQETLRDVLGGGGDSLHWPRIALFLGALIVSDIVSLVVQSATSGGFPPPLFLVFYLAGDLVLTAAAVLAFRFFRHPALAALLTAVFYIVGMMPLRVWQLLNFPPDFRWHWLLMSVLVYGLIGNFLNFLGMHFGLRWLGMLFPGLALGSVVAAIATEVLRTVAAMLTAEFTFSLRHTAEGLAFGIGTAVAFAGAIWIGMQIPVMRAYVSAEAAAMPGYAPLAAPGGEAAELQRAADFRTVRKTLKPAAIGSIVFGVIAIGLGIASLKDSPVNAVLVLLGLGLLGEGIWILVQPTPVGMIIDGIALCLLGLWNLFVTILNASSGGKGPGAFGILGVFQIIMGIQSFRRYRRFAGAAGGTASAEVIKRVDELVAGVEASSEKASPDIIEFTAKGVAWKGRLAGDLAVLVAQGEQDVVLARKSEFLITPQEAPGSGKTFKAAFQFGPHNDSGAISPESYQRYERWKSSR